jgi:histidine triad (HIT) family protein
MCLFCKIANKEILKEFIYEDSDVLAFDDIHPLAPIHVLVIPKRHIESINDIKEKDGELLGKIIIVAQKIAKKLQTDEKGYKLLFRVGSWGGQIVPHIHLHLIGGAKLAEDIHPAK